MKRIAMLNCLRANEVCAGAACLEAWNRKAKAFARYEGEPVELAAFLRCNGCGKDPEDDKGMREKLERLQKIGVNAVHVGVCTKNREGVRCATIARLMERLEQMGIECVDGTH